MCVVGGFVVLLPYPFPFSGWDGDEVSSSIFIDMSYYILCLYSVFLSIYVIFWVAFYNGDLGVWDN